MRNPKHCKDLHAIKIISGNSHKPPKFGTSNYKQFNWEEHKHMINQEHNVSDPNSDDFTDNTDFWRQNDTFNYYLGFESTTEPNDSVLDKTTTEAGSKDESFILWIDTIRDIKEAVDKKLTKEDNVKIDFRQTFAQGIDYLFKYDDKIRSSTYQIVCRAYYRDEDKNSLDLLDLLIDLRLDSIPVLVFTKDRAIVEYHLDTQAPAMDLHNWKERLFITNEIDELIKKLKENIANKKGNSAP
ncbi:unnamed protein product [Rotaria sp. Silwood2]|nr:unnamed protein product [Rotaria sp. Silwood2]